MPPLSAAQSQCGIRPDEARAVQIGSRPTVNSSVRVGLDKVCLMTSVSNPEFSAFLTAINPFTAEELNRFFADFGSENQSLETMVQDRSIVNGKTLLEIWKNNLSNINRTQIAWLKWIQRNRPRLPELTSEVLDHIYKGEITISFKDATPPFKATPRTVWKDLEDKFKAEDAFAIAILKTDNIAGITFGGLHSMDEMEALKLIVVHGQALISYTSKTPTPTTDVNGKKAYNVNNPTTWMPDVSNLKSINKNIPLNKRKWTTKPYPNQKPKPRISSTFLEGMTPLQIEQMICEAFVVKAATTGGREWFGIINKDSKKIQVRGYLDAVGNISSAFIENIY